MIDAIKSNGRFSLNLVLAAACITMLLMNVQQANAELTAVPDQIVFSDLETQVKVELLHDGIALPGSAVNSTGFYVDEHRYDHMIQIERGETGLVVSPTEFLEIGTYDLIIETTVGSTKIRVSSPLNDLPTSLENRARRLGVSVEELTKSYGLQTPMGREIVDLGIPSRYFVGQVFDINMEGDIDRLVTWRINGEVVEEGLGSYALRYVFREPGDYIISMQETQEGVIVSTSVGQTRVVPEAPIEKEVEVGKPVSLIAPDGYDSYTWFLADQVLTREQLLLHEFDYPGVYSLTCVSESVGEVTAFRKLSYNIIVTRP
jgi:hypothetical protein